MADLIVLAPTPTRLALMYAVDLGEVYGYAWAKPLILHRPGLGECTVTARVVELLDVGFVRWQHGGTGDREPLVLTNAGREWLDKHGGVQ